MGFPPDIIVITAEGASNVGYPNASIWYKGTVIKEVYIEGPHAKDCISVTGTEIQISPVPGRYATNQGFFLAAFQLS